MEQGAGELNDVPSPGGVSIRPLEGDPDVLADLAPRRVLSALAYREACRCLVAWSGDRPVGHECWSERLDPEFDRLPVPLPAGTAFGHDLYVAPAFRGRGIGTALAAERLADCSAHGYRRLRRLVEPGNAASWKTADRSAPYVVAGEVWFVRTPGRLRAGFDPA